MDKNSLYLGYTRGVLLPRAPPLTTKLIKINRILQTLEIAMGINKPNKIWNKYSFRRRLELYRIKLQYK